MSWYSRLTLRGRTVVVGAALTTVLVVVGVAVPVPYVAVGPGVTFDTLGSIDGTPVIAFSGDGVPAAANDPEPANGRLNMTTISVTDGIRLFQALGLWATGEYALAPREDYYPPDKTVDQVRAEDAQAFRDSQSSAEIAALNHLGYPQVVYVGTINGDSPSAGVLEPQDQITAIDRTPVTDLASLSAALNGTVPGQVVDVTVARDGQDVDRKVTLGAVPAASAGSTADTGDPGRGYLGVSAVQRPKAPFTITISLEKIGGPSAGLMFTLGIIDRLGGQDLTGGTFVAGTGTMANDGTVGPIGGVLLKLITARDAGATVFLVPDQNCAEARTQVPDGLQLVRVATLDDALSALATLRAGGTPPGC